MNFDEKYAEMKERLNSLVWVVPHIRPRHCWDSNVMPADLDSMRKTQLKTEPVGEDILAEYL